MFSLLYVDDEPGLLELGKLFLESTGEYNVTTALSGDRCLEHLARGSFDAIVSDYQMPGMDGISLLKNVRKSFGNIPFVLFTGRGREEVVIDAINNGVDFYLQKGGDPKAQFAELAHKIRQAVSRRRAETALWDSEKRLADIINFLPDATFAIDTEGKVIAWNRAIEEMTGISADAMLGKGEYEYALPFYGTRRRILIDLVFEPEIETREQYTGITREKDVLIAETDLPRPKGMQRTLMGKASPLYNRKGTVIGAIESIRDITEKKATEAALQEQNMVLARMNQLSLELAAIPSHENIREFAIKKLVEMTGAVAAWFCDYDPAGRFLAINHLEVTPPLLKEATRLLGKLPEEFQTPVSEDLYSKIINSRVLKFSTLTEVSFGEVSPVVSRSIQALAGIDRFYGLAYVIEGNLYGTSVLALKKGQNDPSKELLESFAHIMAVSLRRRSSEERLAASEEKFRTVADYTYGWEYWEGPDRRIVYMSPSCERISGYSAEDFYRIPRLLDSVVDPRDREVWEDHRKEAEKTITALSTDFRIVRKDGGIRWINHICHPVYDAGGRPQGRRASNRDITEKKQKDDELRAAYEQLSASQEELKGQYDELASGEQRIRESEEKFRTFMEASTDGVMLIDVTGGVLAWNRAAEQIFGIPATEAIGSNIIDLQILLIVPEHKNPAFIEGLRSQFATSFPELFSEKAPLIIETEVMNVRGRRITIQQTLFPIRTSSGKRIGCITREVTEQRNAEKNLRESEAKYRELAELLPQIVFETDPAFRITFANQKALTTMDLTEKDIEAGVTALSFIDPSDRERIRQNIEKILRGEPVENHEYTAVRRDSSTFPVMIYAALFSRDGKPAGFRGVVIDITDQKKAEKELKESEERFKTLFEKSAEAQLLLDGTGKVADCNAAFLTLFALKDKEEIRGHVPEDFAPEFQPDGIRSSERGNEIIALLMREGIARYDWAHLKHDAARTPILTDVICTLIQIAGQPMIHANIRDITDRKKAEEVLRESEEKFRGIFDTINDGVHINEIAPDGKPGKFIEVNEVACRMLQYTREELLEHGPLDFVAGAHSRPLDEIIRGLTATGHSIFETSHQRKDGTIVPVEIHAHIVSLRGKQVIVSVVRDITERKQLDEELRAQQQQLNNFMQNLPVGIFRTTPGPTGRRIMANPVLAQMHGFEDFDEFMDCPIADLYANPAERKIISDTLIEKGAVTNLEVQLKKKNGELFWALLSAVAVRGPDGIIEYFDGVIRDITERKRTEDALGESEEKYRMLIEKSLDGIVVVQDERIAFVNKALMEMIGYSEEELLGHSVEEFVAPEDAGVVLNRHRERMTGKNVPSSYEYSLLHKDGVTRITVKMNAGIATFRGKPSMIATFQNVTLERKREAALRESEEKYRTLVETTSDFIWEVDASGAYTYVSPQVRRILGYEPEELLGKTPFDLMPPDEAEKVAAAFRQCVDAQLPIVALENRALRKDGSVVILETSGVVRTGKDGSYEGYRGIDRDITARKLTEVALRESEEWGRTILNTAQAGIILVDAQTHRILDANRKALDLIGSSRDAVIGETCHLFICPAEEGKCPVTDCGQEVDTSERILLTAAGTQIAVLKTVVPASIGGRNVLVESFVDISEQKRSEAAIREANRKLNLLNSITRHDIRNQLMIAKGYTQLAALNKPDPVITDFLAKITTAIETIQHQIEFTKTYQELGVHTPVWFSLGEIISSVRPGKIALRCTCNAFEIFADPMIDNVFFNLIDNAVKHGTRVTAVTIACEEKETGLVITFADNGNGIPDNEKEKIFEKGYGKNTGFGLFLVREILAITGITIHETGTYGKGAVFEITVPDGAFRKGARPV